MHETPMSQATDAEIREAIESIVKEKLAKREKERGPLIKRASSQNQKTRTGTKKRR